MTTSYILKKGFLIPLYYMMALEFEYNDTWGNDSRRNDTHPINTHKHDTQQWNDT